MSMKLNKKQYEKLIQQDLDFLTKHCPDTPELDHIKLIVCRSVDWYYPDKSAFNALSRIESRLKIEIQRQKDAGKQFPTEQEMVALIDGIIKEKQN